MTDRDIDTHKTQRHRDSLSLPLPSTYTHTCTHTYVVGIFNRKLEGLAKNIEMLMKSALSCEPQQKFDLRRQICQKWPICMWKRPICMWKRPVQVTSKTSRCSSTLHSRAHLRDSLICAAKYDKRDLYVRRDLQMCRWDQKGLLLEQVSWSHIADRWDQTSKNYDCHKFQQVFTEVPV